MFPAEDQYPFDSGVQLRLGLYRNFAGIDDERLFERCRVGTKQLIEEFNEEIVDSLKFLASSINSSTNPLELKQKMDLFRDLRHSLGNTALLLSGGGSLGVYHIGVLKALQENGLLPHIIAGASSGSIMAAVACCRSDDEFPGLLRMEGINTNLLEEAVPAEHRGSWLYLWSKKLSRFLKHGVIFDREVLKESLRDSIGDITFVEAYRKTNRVLNIAVSSTTMYDMPRLLNYITSPNVIVWSAVVASCAVPALYESAPLLAKDHRGRIVPWNVTGDRWCDGSVENDLPMKRLSEIFNVNHFIVSQVNPHIYPFVKYTSSSQSRLRALNGKLLHLVKSEVNYRLDQLARLGVLPRACRMLRSVVDQKYHGDITIVPDLTWTDIAHMFVDRPVEAILEAIRRGERATWPKLSMIQSHLGAELTLDQILLNIRDRLLDSQPDGSQASSMDGEAMALEAGLDSKMRTLSHTDVMLDPTVNIRRHLSPDLPFRSLSAFALDGEHASSSSPLVQCQRAQSFSGVLDGGRDLLLLSSPPPSSSLLLAPPKGGRHRRDASMKFRDRQSPTS